MEHKSGIVNREVIQVKASQFWEALRSRNIHLYADEVIPNWTEGWLSGFKARHGLKKYKKHGEAASVDTEATASQMDALCDAIQDYHPRDIFNMDETSNF